MAKIKILIFHLGSLGDTIIFTPAFYAVKKHFPNAEIVMLTNSPVKGAGASAEQVLNKSSLIDRFIYFSDNSLKQAFELGVKLRKEKFNHLVYLARDPEKRWKRDFLFFRAAGIKSFLGTQQFNKQEHILDRMMERLSVSGIELNEPLQATFSILYKNETMPDNIPESFIGLGIGGKKILTKWNIENYQFLIQQLSKKYKKDICIFGGSEDKASADLLCESKENVKSFCGSHSIPATIKILTNCEVFIGNDTGTIHMAATAGARCIGIYSSHDNKGLWHPYGEGNSVLRNDQLECSGCMLTACPYDNKCVNSISVDEVMLEIGKVLEEV